MSSCRKGIDMLLAVSMPIFALNTKYVNLESWHVSLIAWSEIVQAQYWFVHTLASATTNTYTRNLCDSEPAWNWNAYAHCCLLEDSVTLWHMIHMHIQHVCLVVRWSVLLTLHIWVQLNPHPHSMRLRLRIQWDYAYAFLFGLDWHGFWIWCIPLCMKRASQFPKNAASLSCSISIFVHSKWFKSLFCLNSRMLLVHHVIVRLVWTGWGKT